MKEVKILFLILIIPLFAFGLHKYYISLTKIDYVEEEKSVQITMRFFIDDIEKTLENRYEIELELATKQENKKANIYLERYIASKFEVIINQNVKLYKFLGKEYENDVVFFYLEITDIEMINQISIQNRMLFEEFPDQENFVKIDINNFKKTFVLRKENDKEMLNF
jgi:hypothetical protein